MLLLLSLAVIYPRIALSCGEIIEGLWGGSGGAVDGEAPYRVIKIGSEGGVFVYSYPGHDDIVYRFERDDIKKMQGYCEIKLSGCGRIQARLIVSAYRSQRNRESGLMTGVLYMYREEPDQLRLFNSIFFRGERLSSDNSLSKRIESLPGQHCEDEESR